jgi:hypothetical protein
MDEIYIVLEIHAGKRDRQGNCQKGCPMSNIRGDLREVSRSIKARNIHGFVAHPDIKLFMISI